MMMTHAYRMNYHDDNYLTKYITHTCEKVLMMLCVSLIYVGSRMVELGPIRPTDPVSLHKADLMIYC